MENVLFSNSCTVFCITSLLSTFILRVGTAIFKLNVPGFQNQQLPAILAVQKQSVIFQSISYHAILKG